MNGKIFDHSALLQYSAAPEVYRRTLLNVATRDGATLAVPASAYQVTIALRPAAQQTLFDLVTSPGIALHALSDRVDLENAAYLVAPHPELRRDVCAAHCCLIAVQTGWPIVTAEPHLYVPLGLAAEKMP
ncbi:MULTISPECIES: hypothetical protein [Streptosporangium]|uniref:PIN domain-containing protein n=1 Tax=Streptosporangium brasiliense TaxID=47480 RepID=A0ABT9RHP2_9ACTN|nr:hypothetical protein [Streptosporangium brasiliense]MDP9868371.1 hypothetical protein [Streptosporangium brasiliense]